MESTTGFTAYCLYQAIKLHFTSDYDYFKYNGKTNVTQNSFLHNKSKYSFYKLSRKYSYDELREYFVSNFIDRDVNWVGEIMGPEGEETYKKWQKRIQSLTYRFEQDTMHLIETSGTPEEMLKVKDGNYPKLLTETMQGNVSLETLTILNDLMNFFPMWNKKITDDIIWPSYHKKCVKYAPFIHYDKTKFKTILLESIEEHA